MPARTVHPLGTPCWTDLAAPDLDGAAAFYAAVFGWRAEGVPGTGGAYRVMHAPGGRVCGVYAMDPARRGRGDTPAWLTYLAVDDAAARQERALALGGRVLRPVSEVPGTGRVALVADPTGGAVALWEPGGLPGADVVREPGAMTWNELASPEPAAAAAFLAALLGLRAEEMPGDFAYTTLADAEGPVAGVYRGGPDEPAEWRVYFAVEDAGATADRIRAAGGEVVQDPGATADGRVGVAADPWDAIFAFAQLPGGG